MRGVLQYRNAMVFDSDTRSFRLGGLTVNNGIIVSTDNPKKGADLGGGYILPGLIDSHTHGREGMAFGQADEEQLRRMKAAYRRLGVTTVFPTFGTQETLDAWITAIEACKKVGFERMHLEGRYLCEKRRGAHREDWLSALDGKEIARLVEVAAPVGLHVSAAYEEKGGEAFLRAVLENGCTAGLGHSNATGEQAIKLVEQGVTCFTHLFNAMSPLHHRDVGVAGAGLVTDAYVEIICDGIHLAPETVKLVSRCKDKEKVVLITDSISPAGLPDGEYESIGKTVTVREGLALNDEGVISGSTLDLYNGVLNYMRFAGVPFADAVAAATVNPATLHGISDRAGALKAGRKADYLIVDKHFRLVEVSEE